MPLPAQGLTSGRRLMREEAYEALRDLIVAGTLSPGEPLNDQAVARWLGVSRMPVREALVGLAADGLVVIAPNRFTRVAPLDASGAAAAHRLMGLLEADLATRPMVNDVQALRERAEIFSWALWRGDAEEALAADRALHGRLRDKADPLTAGVVGRLDPLARRAQRACWAVIAEAWPEASHGRLIEAIESDDSHAARAAIEGEWDELGAAVSRALAAG